VPYLSASAVVMHYEEALYQVYGPLPYLYLYHTTRDSGTTFNVNRSKAKVTRPLWLPVQVTT